MTKNVIFDFGGVLVEWDPDAILMGFFDDDGLRRAARAGIFRHPDWSEIDRGTLTEEEAVRRFSERLGRSVAEMEALMGAMRASLRPIAGTVELLRDLVARDVPVFGISNMSRTTYDYLHARDDFWALFRDIVISADLSTIKPERAIFHQSLARFEVSPESCIFTDDHAANVDSARACGLRAFRFASPAQCRAEIDAFLRGP